MALWTRLFFLLLGHQARRSQPLRLPRSTPSRSAAVCAPSYIHLAPAALGRSQDCQPQSHRPRDASADHHAGYLYITPLSFSPIVMILPLSGRTLLAALQSQVAIRAIPVCDTVSFPHAFSLPRLSWRRVSYCSHVGPSDVILLTAHSSPCGSRGWPVSHGQTHTYTVLLASWFQQLQRSKLSAFISDPYHVSTMP
ncbi:hypothetical protein B0H14DRAFT_2954805 [Mycena olivaceomarginata]|nr:hypothetical protein B0H14DRAFT_2954805 [Mycena olivaceomarginata]